jgi:hypothetical protein
MAQFWRAEVDKDAGDISMDWESERQSGIVERRIK